MWVCGGGDIPSGESDGASQRLLETIDMKTVDYLLALTRIDEVNLVCSRISKSIIWKKNRILCVWNNDPSTNYKGSITYTKTYQDM